MTERLKADRPERLLALLRRGLPGWKRTTLEQRIRAGCVRVNGRATATNDLVAAGDDVELVDPAQAEPPPPPMPAGLRLLHDDDALVAIDKPAGLLSVSTDDERTRTALALVRGWLIGPSTVHLSPKLATSYLEDGLELIMEAHAQTLKTLLHQCGLTEADLVPR